MPIIITGGAGDTGGRAFADAFMSSRKRAQDQRNREADAAKDEERYQDAQKVAREKITREQIKELAELQANKNARFPGVYQGRHDAKPGTTGWPGTGSGQDADAALKAFGEVASGAEMTPEELFQITQGMPPEDEAVFGNLPLEQQIYHAKREARLRQERALAQAFQQAQGDLTTTRALEVSGRVPEGTADLLEQQLQAGELDPRELRKATIQSEQSAAEYHDSVSESERLTTRWRAEQELRGTGDEPLEPQARAVIAELETALRLREGHPGMDPIDFEGFAKRFRRASVPEGVENEIAMEAVQAAVAQAEYNARSYQDVQGERERSEFGAPQAPRAPSPKVSGGASPPSPGSAKPVKASSLRDLKKSNPEQLQQTMGALKAFLSELVESGDASSAADLWKKLREKAKELGVTASRAELEKHLNFEAPYEQGADAPPLRKGYKEYYEKRKKSGKGGTGGSGEQEGA